jgi:hypothetical protein
MGFDCDEDKSDACFLERGFRKAKQREVQEYENNAHQD